MVERGIVEKNPGLKPEVGMEGTVLQAKEEPSKTVQDMKDVGTTSELTNEEISSQKEVKVATLALEEIDDGVSGEVKNTELALEEKNGTGKVDEGTLSSADPSLALEKVVESESTLAVKEVNDSGIGASQGMATDNSGVGLPMECEGSGTSDKLMTEEFKEKCRQQESSSDVDADANDDSIDVPSESPDNDEVEVDDDDSDCQIVSESSSPSSSKAFKLKQRRVEDFMQLPSQAFKQSPSYKHDLPCWVDKFDKLFEYVKEGPPHEKSKKPVYLFRCKRCIGSKRLSIAGVGGFLVHLKKTHAKQYASFIKENPGYVPKKLKKKLI